jgi:hypothetical protein
MDGLPQTILRKHTAAVHSSSPLSLVQQKAINALLRHAMRDRNILDDVYHEVPIRLLMEDLGYKESTRSYSEDLRKSLFELSEINVRWNILKKDKRGKVSGQSPYLASIVLDNGVIRYTFSKEIRDSFFKPHLYARLDLNYQKQFKLKSSLPIWELLWEELSTKKKDEICTDWIDYENIINLLGIAGDFYINNFALFKNKVLNPCLTEINEKSDVTVSLEEKRGERNRIKSLRFRVSTKNKVSFETSVEDVFFAPYCEKRPKEGASIDEDPKFNLKKIGIPDQMISEIKKTHTEEQIQNAIEFFLAEFDPVKIKNPIAFFNKTLKEGWVLPKIMNQRLEQIAEDNQSEQNEDLAADINNRAEADSFKRIRLELLKSLGKAQYTSWIHPLQFKLDKERILIIANTPFIRDWIENKYRQDIVAAAKKCIEHKNIIVEFSTIEDLKLEVV